MAPARRAGFTLIELMVVIALIAVLMVIVLAGLNRATKSARRAASERSAAALAQAVDQFKSEFGFLPPLVHDGPMMSGGNADYQPAVFRNGDSPKDGPLYPVPGSSYASVVVWSEGPDFNFFRRRTGSGADAIELPGGGEWDDEDAWDDRRYSKYALAYYLLGILNRNVDGVRGPGFARPIIDGTFLGVGYPVGSVRDRFDPLMDVERRGAGITPDYINPREYPEHGGGEAPERDSIYSGYDSIFAGGGSDNLIDRSIALAAIVDSFGNAFRYYRWEPGRFVNGRLTVENQLDLNIPPVLIDPVVYAKVMNDPALLGDKDTDLTGGNTRLRDARYAVVGAGPDGLFGTENIETIAAQLRVETPSDLASQAKLRQQVWADNAWEVGN